MSDIVNFFIFSYASEMKCPLTGKNCLKHKCFEAEGKLLCEDCFHKKAENLRLANDTICPSCGMTLAEIIKGIRLGCASCYDHFAETMPYIVGSVQMGDSNMRHTGSIPRGFLMDRAKITSSEEIREEILMRMNSASLDEKYKEAAKMRSKIVELDKLLKETGRADLAERLALFIFNFWTSLEALD